MKLQLTDRQGNKVLIGAMIAQGGEGAIHAIEGHSKFVAKLYHRPPDEQKAKKLEAMVDAKTERLLKLCAWPVEILSHHRGEPPVGIVMPRIDGFKDIHLLYGPRSRMRNYPLAGWEFLVRTAANLARAFAVVHEHDHVIGDVNDKVALVSDQATVKLIDCDGFQISANKDTYSCDVGVLTHQPPELQDVHTFRGLHRTPNHDNFGLAVLIFQLLFLARHPFSGTWLGKGDMPLERAIHEFRFVYGKDAKKREMSPPPHALGLEEVTPELAKLFEAAFSKRGVKNSRPRASVWAQTLDDMAKALKRCHTNPSHAYVRGRTCPFCPIEAQAPSALFNLPVLWKGKGGINRTLCVNLGKLWGSIRNVDGPGPPSKVEGVEEGHSLAHELRRRAQPNKAGRFALMGGSLLGTGVAAATLGPVGLLGAGVVPFLWPRKPKNSGELESAADHWDQIYGRWEKSAKGTDFVRMQTDLQGAKKALESLDEEHERRMTELRSSRKEDQLASYLDRHRIADSSISGISRAATVVLESYGIETAKDVSDKALSGLSGLGAVARKALLNWRADLESRFRFNPKKGLDPMAVAQVERDTQKRRAHLVQVLVDGPARLRNAAKMVRSQRRTTTREIEQTLEELRRASRAA